MLSFYIFIDRVYKTASEQPTQQVSNRSFHAKNSRTQAHRGETDLAQSIDLALNEPALRSDREHDRLGDASRYFTLSSGIGEQRQLPTDHLWRHLPDK